MATFRLSGGVSSYWSYYNSGWSSVDYIIYDEYYGNPIGNIPRSGTYAAGQAIKLLSKYDGIPADFGGIATSAIYYGKSYAFENIGNRTVYYRLGFGSNDWTSSAPPNLQSKSISFSPSIANYTVDLTTQFNDYIGQSLSNDYLWIYFHRKDNDEFGNSCLEVYGSWESYLEITYTPVSPNSTIALYDSTTSTWKNRPIKKRVSGAWVDCDCYKYNGTSWDKVSTT